jgi:hypothetical protein
MIVSLDDVRCQRSSVADLQYCNVCGVSEVHERICNIRERNTNWQPLHKRVATELVPVQMIAWPRQLLVRATQSNDFMQQVAGDTVVLQKER